MMIPALTAMRMMMTVTVMMMQMVVKLTMLKMRRMDIRMKRKTLLPEDHDYADDSYYQDHEPEQDRHVQDSDDHGDADQESHYGENE